MFQKPPNLSVEISENQVKNFTPKKSESENHSRFISSCVAGLLCIYKYSVYKYIYIYTGNVKNGFTEKDGNWKNKNFPSNQCGIFGGVGGTLKAMKPLVLPSIILNLFFFLAQNTTLSYILDCFLLLTKNVFILCMIYFATFYTSMLRFISICCQT